ncbi:MAG TPA: hypothetical protein VGM90_08100 [Kofleriaceae bacterium]|jgi:hypothetical protein
MSEWRADLRKEIENHPDFGEYCRERGAREPSLWIAADTPMLAGLEAWARELATRNPRLGIAVLAAAAGKGLAVAMASAGDEAESMGFHASEPHEDGVPVETQIARGLAFLDAPTNATLKDVNDGFDPTRQLYAWGEDLMPGADMQPWYWYLDVGQCLACAIRKGDATSPTEDMDSMDDAGEVEPPTVEDFDAADREAGYESWPAAVCVARGLVMACRGLRAAESSDDEPGLATLRAAMVGP